MNDIKLDIILDIRDSRGVFDYRIKWIPPKGTGYIVQYVEIEDPLKLIENYKKPFYEAWEVNNGETENSDYDDRFNNSADGFAKDIVIDYTQEILKKRGLNESYIEYKCYVYWISIRNKHYEEVSKWKPGGLGCMSGQLPCSYNEYDFGKPCLERIFHFKIERVNY